MAPTESPVPAGPPSSGKRQGKDSPSRATYRHAQIDANLIQDLSDDLLALLLVLQPRHVVDGVVHHLLPLVHDVIFLLELHGDALQRGEVHAAVHGAQERGRAFHRLHHLFVGAYGLDAEGDGLQLGAHGVEFLDVSVGLAGGEG